MHHHELVDFASVVCVAEIENGPLDFVIVAFVVEFLNDVVHDAEVNGSEIDGVVVIENVIDDETMVGNDHLDYHRGNPDDHHHLVHGNPDDRRRGDNLFLGNVLLDYRDAFVGQKQQLVRVRQFLFDPFQRWPLPRLAFP